MLKKVEDVEFILVHRIVGTPGGARDLRREDQEEENVSDVQLPYPLHQPLGGGEKMAAAHRGPIDEAGEIAGDEHEELGGVTEAVIAQRQPADDVVRNMVEKNHPLPDAAKQIEPQ